MALPSFLRVGQQLCRIFYHGCRCRYGGFIRRDHSDDGWKYEYGKPKTKGRQRIKIHCSALANMTPDSCRTIYPVAAKPAMRGLSDSLLKGASYHYKVYPVLR